MAQCAVRVWYSRGVALLAVTSVGDHSHMQYSDHLNVTGCAFKLPVTSRNLVTVYCDFVTENSSCHTYFQGPVSATVLI